MLLDRDHYEVYYADKLWQLIPSIYRQEDTDKFDKNGPLRELVNRIGKHAAIVRRSIDRTWEDQSIETCDDWVIPYIADLFATNLVGGLGSRGQRLDVAKTIYYRRRKGTLGLIEELAADITGWEARVVEFFGRLGRTRHPLDPEIGPWAQPDTDQGRLQRAEGLIGTLTKTGIGGLADLRSVNGASKQGGAYDEFFYTADVRRGIGRTGWYNVPRLGIFVWRLYSFGVDWTTPVPVEGCEGHFTFDPTGREIPLFSKSARQAGKAYGDSWVSPLEWQLPTPITKSILGEAIKTPEDVPLIATTELTTGESDRKAVGVFNKPGMDYIAIATDQIYADRDDAPAGKDDDAPAGKDAVVIYPAIGRFQVIDVPVEKDFYCTYHYGFSSTIGAGPYDRRKFVEETIPEGDVRDGADELKMEISAPISNRDVTIGDSLTYYHPGDVTGIDDFSLRAENLKRPAIRLLDDAKPPGPKIWTLTGNPDSQLLLDGLLLCGADIVLEGTFNRVSIKYCTLDPGLWDSGSIASAADGALLQPCKLRIKGNIDEIVIDRSICGPILVEDGGTVQTVSIADSIVQAFDGDKALDIPSGVTKLERVTVLGPAEVHRIYASDSILGGEFTVTDLQHGCVRFSSYTEASSLPSPYESVKVGPDVPLFYSRDLGDPDYCQLRDGADLLIIGGDGGQSISSGSESGSEMGAFCGEKNAIKEKSLLIKLEEYMPLGLVPVIINST